jgi:hypothetical protein
MITNIRNILSSPLGWNVEELCPSNMFTTTYLTTQCPNTEDNNINHYHCENYRFFLGWKPFLFTHCTFVTAQCPCKQVYNFNTKYIRWIMSYMEDEEWQRIFIANQQITRFIHKMVIIILVSKVSNALSNMRYLKVNVRLLYKVNIYKIKFLSFSW